MWWRLGRVGIHMLHVRDVLVPNPRQLFGYWDGQGYIPCEYHLLKWVLTGVRPDIVQDEETSVSGIDEVAAKAKEVCRVKGWKRGWSNGGCYLHLEVSEFIEALRGKGVDPDPEDEAADVLFVLLSMLLAEDISPSDVLKRLDTKCDELLAKPHAEERRCTCSYEDSEEMTRHAPLCQARQETA